MGPIWLLRLISFFIMAGTVSAFWTEGSLTSICTPSGVNNPQAIDTAGGTDFYIFDRAAAFNMTIWKFDSSCSYISSGGFATSSATGNGGGFDGTNLWALSDISGAVDSKVYKVSTSYSNLGFFSVNSMDTPAQSTMWFNNNFWIANTGFGSIIQINEVQAFSDGDTTNSIVTTISYPSECIRSGHLFQLSTTNFALICFVHEDSEGDAFWFVYNKNGNLLESYKYCDCTFSEGTNTCPSSCFWDPTDEDHVEYSNLSSFFRFDNGEPLSHNLYCHPPTSGTWNIEKSCEVHNDTVIAGNVNILTDWLAIFAKLTFTGSSQLINIYPGSNITMLSGGSING